MCFIEHLEQGWSQIGKFVPLVLSYNSGIELLTGSISFEFGQQHKAGVKQVSENLGKKRYQPNCTRGQNSLRGLEKA